MTTTWKSVVADLCTVTKVVEDHRGPKDIPADLMAQLSAAGRAMASFPVTSITMLAEKMNILVEQFGIHDFGGGDEARYVYADILRLAGQSASEDEAPWSSAAEDVMVARAAYDAATEEYDRLAAERTARFGPPPRPIDTVSREEAEWCKTSGYDVACEQTDATSTLWDAKQWALLLLPAPHIPALVHKIEWLLDDIDNKDDAQAAIRNDVHRLLGEAAA